MCRTEEGKTVSSAVGMLNPLMAVGVPNESITSFLESAMVRLSAKSKETGFMSVGSKENRSMALS
jgi:hypothetical protein